jgi:hypothetical protein
VKIIDNYYVCVIAFIIIVIIMDYVLCCGNLFISVNLIIPRTRDYLEEPIIVKQVKKLPLFSGIGRPVIFTTARHESLS